MSDAPLEVRVREEVGRLTREPPEGFTAARDARVKALRADGDRELARELATRRRPTLSAWAVDQLAHRHDEELAELLTAATRLRDAQAASPPDRRAVREATRTFTGGVHRLRGLAADRLRDLGSAPDPHLDEVEATLLAAATDPEVAADVRAGALLRPAPAPGFAAFAAPTATDLDEVTPADRGGDGAPPAGAGPGGADDDPEVAAARRRREELTVRLGELGAARDRLRDQRNRLDGRADAGTAEVERLRGEAAALRAEADERDAAADEAARATEAVVRDRDEVDGELGTVEAELRTTEEALGTDAAR